MNGGFFGVMLHDGCIQILHLFLRSAPVGRHHTFINRSNAAVNRGAGFVLRVAAAAAASAVCTTGPRHIPAACLFDGTDWTRKLAIDRVIRYRTRVEIAVEFVVPVTQHHHFKRVVGGVRFAA